MGKKASSSSSPFWHPRRRSSSAPATPRAAEPPLGCMSMVHYLIFAPGAGCVGRPPTSVNAVVAPPRDTMNWHEEDKEASRGSVKEENRGGLEAPRNSLDLDADNINDIPIGVQIEPVFDALACRKMRSKATAPSSEAETPRTPSLVARLMGIDGLPESNNSPSPAQQLKKKPTATSRASKENSTSSPASASKEKKKRVIPESVNSNRRETLRSLSCNVPVSLPESPRGSTASARASWDGARLSLQALKENVLERAAQYMSLPTSPTSAAANGKTKKKKKNSQQDTNKERVTAKEIVRQAKEAVANRNKEKQRQQQSFASADHDNKENIMSPAPVRKDKSLLLQERKHHQPPPTTERRVALAPKNPPPPPPPHRAKPSRPPPPPPPIIEAPRAAKKPDGCERFATRIKKPAAAAAASNGGTTSSPVTPPAPAARSSSPPRSSSGGHVARSLLEEQRNPEYSYLRKVLERGGFFTRSTSSGRPFKGHSVSSPVDPIVFHLLELELPAEQEEERLGPLRHRWNRKLMFHLAQEILADLHHVSSLPPGSGGIAAVRKSSPSSGHAKVMISGPELLSRVWNRVRSFPAADCRVVGDIDALVAMDLHSPATVRRLGQHPAVLEEASDVAEDVADQVLDTLLQECLPLPEDEQESLFLSLSIHPVTCAPVM